MSDEGKKNVAKLNGDLVYWNCPGCECSHAVRVNLENPEWKIHRAWTWNSSLERPTFSPSVLSKGIIECHCFVENGQIRFLADSQHKLAGKTVPMEPWE